MARIVFATIGSHGDVIPMLPVAAKLRLDGHAVVFVVPQHLAGPVIDMGFDCRAVVIPRFGGTRAEEESTTRSDIQARIRERFPSVVEQMSRVLVPALEGAEIMVTGPTQLAVTMVATKLGLRWVTLTVYPGNIPSSYTVPQPHWLPALPTPLGRLVNRMTWRIFDFAVDFVTGEPTREASENAGLTADRRLLAAGGLSPYLTIVLSSPVYSPRQPDWPAQIRIVGSTPSYEPGDWQDPPALTRFVAEGEPPVLVTTSTAGERDAPLLFRSAARALVEIKKRGILLLGGAARKMNIEPGGQVEPGVIAWPYLPLSRVVPMTSLVVHHAGIGTTLITLRSGRPCVAIPAMFDQWYNASRVKKLGVGRTLEWKRFTTERLAAEITLVDRSPHYRERAQAIGEVIAQEDGAAQACSEIEALLAAPPAR